MNSDDAPREESDPSQLWGTEPPKLSGAGWRRAQRLEPTAEDEARRPVPRPPALQRPASAHQATGLEGRLAALEDAVIELARSVQQAGWASSAAEMRAEIEALRGGIADLQGVLPSETLLVDLVRAEGERSRATLAQNEEAAAARWNALLESIRDELAGAGEAEADSPRRQAVERARQGVETLHASLAELRSSLNSEANAELGALVQAEAQGARTEVARLRTGPIGEHLARLQTEIEGVRDGVRSVEARVADIPSIESLVEAVMHQSDRSRGQLEDMTVAMQAALEDLRRRSDQLDAGIDELSAKLDANRPADLTPVELTLRSEIERAKAELLGAGEETDARQRAVMAALAREVVSLTEGQIALREDFNKLLARLLGRRS
jgi:chromosome segregation ATPase